MTQTDTSAALADVPALPVHRDKCAECGTKLMWHQQHVGGRGDVMFRVCPVRLRTEEAGHTCREAVWADYSI